MAGLKTRMIGFVGRFFTARQAKITRGAQTRRSPGGEGRLKQITAGRGIEIEHFARDENARHFMQHKALVAGLETHPARCRNCSFEP